MSHPSLFYAVCTQTERIQLTSRRSFLKTCSATAGGVVLGRSGVLSAMTHGMATQANTLNASTLTPFVDPLPIPQVAKSSGMRPLPSSPKTSVPFYRFAAQPTEMKIHRDLKPTRFWSFGTSVPGPTLEMRSGEEVLVEWANELPQQHFLPIDYRLHGAADGNPQVRIVSHLHGARVPADSDGFPEDWFVPGKSALYHYPNQQDAAMLWYHDHAMGINRLNVYAGLFGVAILRDQYEDGLNLPSGKYEIPLTLFDRLITPEGQLYYPISDKPKAPWVPEFSGDAILVNGKLFPYLEVEPRKYRFRVLNSSNGRFCYLSLHNGLGFHQIGTDQGLLPAPVSGLRRFWAWSRPSSCSRFHRTRSTQCSNFRLTSCSTRTRRDGSGSMSRGPGVSTGSGRIRSISSGAPQRRSWWIWRKVFEAADIARGWRVRNGQDAKSRPWTRSMFRGR